MSLRAASHTVIGYF